MARRDTLTRTSVIDGRMPRHAHRQIATCHSRVSVPDSAASSSASLHGDVELLRWMILLCQTIAFNSPAEGLMSVDYVAF